MSRDSRLYLEDILEAAIRVRTYLAGASRQTLDSDLRTRDAVLYNLGVIGEAVKKLPEDLTERHPAVDWSGFARSRAPPSSSACWIGAPRPCASFWSGIMMTMMMPRRPS